MIWSLRLGLNYAWLSVKKVVSSTTAFHCKMLAKRINCMLSGIMHFSNELHTEVAKNLSLSLAMLYGIVCGKL